MPSRLFIALTVLALAPVVVEAAGRGAGLGHCDDDVRAGYHFYCDPDAVQEAEEEVAPEVAAPPPVSPDTVKSATEEMMEFRARLDELKYEAVLRPTPENLEAYMTAQLAMIRKAQVFTEQWQRVLMQAPELDTNTRYPLSNVGTHVYQDRKQAAWEASLRAAAETHGLLFVFGNEVTCPVCPTQVAIVAELEAKYGLTVMPVTADGWAYPQFPEPAPDTGQLANLGLSDFPRPILGLIEPGSGAVDVIGAGLLTADQILERVHLLTGVAAGTQFSGGIP